MRIYTKTGDSGETGLFGGGRVSKNDIRVVAYGEVDELNALLGVAAAAVRDAGIAELLHTLQPDLFVYPDEDTISFTRRRRRSRAQISATRVDQSGDCNGAARRANVSTRLTAPLTVRLE